MTRAKLIGAAVFTTVLAGCGRSDEPMPDGDVVQNAPYMAEARKDMADGLRCMNLLAAIVSAKNGPLRDQIERAGLSGIEPEFAERWEERVTRDARRGGLSAEDARRLVDDQPSVVLDEEELRGSAGEAYDCAADVNGSHGG